MMRLAAPDPGRREKGGADRFHKAYREVAVTDLSSLSSSELADRIAIVRGNIRQITEQAAVLSGAADEARNADRLAKQNDELDALLEEQARRSRK